MMFNDSPLSFSERTSEPQPRTTPEPCLEVECNYSLTGGAQIAALIYAFPTADVTIGTQYVAECRVHVARVGHTWATMGEANPTHIPITFRIALPFSLIEQIQGARAKLGAEKDVVFRIHPNLGVSRVYGSTQTGTGYMAGITVQVYEDRIQSDPIHLSRDHWLVMMERLGFTDSLVIELPVVPGGPSPVRDALQHLRAARTAFANGAFDDVGVKAFKAFEALVPLNGKGPVFDAIAKDYFASAHEQVATAAKEMLIRLAALYHVGGRHHAGGVPVARHHARFLLGAAEMVVAWCAEVGRP